MQKVTKKLRSFRNSLPMILMTKAQTVHYCSKCRINSYLVSNLSYRASLSRVSEIDLARHYATVKSKGICLDLALTRLSDRRDQYIGAQMNAFVRACRERHRLSKSASQQNSRLGSSTCPVSHTGRIIQSRLCVLARIILRKLLCRLRYSTKIHKKRVLHIRCLNRHYKWRD